MVNISRYFLASAQELCSHCTNRNVVYEAMKCVVKKSLEYKHAIYVKNLYGNLKKDGIGTTTIEGLSQKKGEQEEREKVQNRSKQKETVAIKQKKVFHISETLRRVKP